MNTKSLPPRTTPEFPAADDADAADAADAAAIEKPQPPIHTTTLPVAHVRMDAEVRDAYLSEDLETICAIAAITGAAVLIASAGHPLDQRETAFRIWRKRGLESLESSSPEIGTFLATHPDLRAQYDAGTVDLIVLDRALHDAHEEENKKRRDYIVTSKQALRDAVAKHTPDAEEGRFPKICIIRGDGELKVFRNRPTALEWAREGNFGYHLIPLDTGKREYRPADYELAE